MRCPKCGKEIDAKRNFCEYCGTQIKKNRKPLFITIAIVACLLILGGIGLTQYNKGEQERASIERELSMYKLKAAEAEAKAEAEHEARLKAETEMRLEREAAEKAKYNGHEYVDLGLPSGLKWATCNVGADNPEDYGDYYAWGETSVKSTYDESNCKTDGKYMRDIKGNPQYDAARANWGGSWRLPTKAELEELWCECTWEWTTQNGVDGRKVTGPNGNSIFIPNAGYRDGSSLVGEVTGQLWSSTPDDRYGNIAYELSISRFMEVYGVRRYYGKSVRPVSE